MPTAEENRMRVFLKRLRMVAFGVWGGIFIGVVYGVTWALLGAFLGGSILGLLSYIVEREAGQS